LYELVGINFFAVVKLSNVAVGRGRKNQPKNMWL